MKKSCCLVIALFFCIHCLKAQSLRVLPEVGLNIARVHLTYDTKLDFGSIAGPRAGVYFRIPAGSGFYIEPGFFYSQKGYRINDLVVENSPTGNFPKGDLTFRIHTLEVPLNILYELSLKKAGKLFAGIGPYLGANIGGYRILKYEGVKDEGELDFGKDKPDGPVLDFGVNGGIGYETPFRLYARIQYGYGIPELLNSDTGRENRVLSFAVGYNL